MGWKILCIWIRNIPGSRTQLESAITLAYTYGTVVDCDSKSVWKRYRSTHSINRRGFAGYGVEVLLKMQLQQYVIILGLIIMRGLHGTGYSSADNEHDKRSTWNKSYRITCEKALSYVGEGSLVIAKTGEDEYIIITAYNSSEIAYIESSSGSVKTMSMNDAGKMFSQGGNIYVTYYK
ncbi:MAG: hypothetical protein ACLS9K_08835 [Lachnospira eligens]